jgi:hypothetical protein
MRTKVKLSSSEEVRPVKKQAVPNKPRRVLMNTPMLKYVIYDDPTRFDKDMTTGETDY